MTYSSDRPDVDKLSQLKLTLTEKLEYNGYPKTFISSSAVKRTSDKDTERQKDCDSIYQRAERGHQESM